MKKKATKKSGNSYAARSGRTPIGVTVSPEEHEIIKQAAELDGRPKTQFVLRAALAAARKLIAESSQ